MKICFLQFNIAWGDTLANTERIERLIRNEVANADLLVLPEMFNCGFSMDPEGVAETMDGSAIRWMSLIAKRHDIGVVGSIAVCEDENYYNRLVVAFPNGNIETYDKRHLFRMGGEDKKYKAGEKKVIFEFRGVKIRPLICYDLRFPVWSRNVNDYDLLVYIANWPSTRQFAWDSLLVARAIENQCYVLGVNRVGEDPHNNYAGGSILLDYKGQTISKSEPNKECLKNGYINMEKLDHFRHQFPAHTDADRFKIV